MASGGWTRVEFEILDDPELDDLAVAAYVRLRYMAMLAWPGPGMVPAMIAPEMVALFARRGDLVELPGGRYRMPAVDTEKAAARAKARAAGNARWNARADATSIPASNPTSNASAMPIQIQSKNQIQSSSSTPSGGSTPSRARARVTGEIDDPADAVIDWMAEHRVHLPPNGNGLHVRLIKLVDRVGAAAVIREMGAMLTEMGGKASDRQLVLGVEDRLERIPQAPRKPVRSGKGFGPDMEAINRAVSTQ